MASGRCVRGLVSGGVQLYFCSRLKAAISLVGVRVRVRVRVGVRVGVRIRVGVRVRVRVRVGVRVRLRLASPNPNLAWLRSRCSR